MESFYIFRFAVRHLLGDRCSDGVPDGQAGTGHRVDGCRTGDIHGFHCGHVDVVGTSATSDDGRDPVAGIITYIRWRYKWILSFSTVLSFVFICINLFKPEIHNKTLMPALQSPWFAPHVIVYMFAYAMLGAAAIVAVYLLVRSRKRTIDRKVMSLCDNLVYVGTAFLTIGMLFGALWAKEAWGHYWSWDPKETWAAATWLGNLLYIHFRLHRYKQYKIALGLLVFAFVLLQVCWFGVNYLPSAQGNSVHVYNME